MISKSKKHILQLGNLAPIHFLVYCKLAAQNYGWDIQSITETSMVAFVPKTLLSWGERVTIVIDGDTAIIESACIDNQRVDWGKNNSNINKLTSASAELRASVPAEQLAELANEIQHPSESNPSEGAQLFQNQNSGSFLEMFIPREGYFITPILINLNILVFVIMVLFGVSPMSPDSEQLIKWGANYRLQTLQGEPWRLLTSCFLHIGVFHLLLNMYALVYIGTLLEPFLGRTKFAAAYLLTGILGSAASLWWHENTVSAGASGAIFGMYGLFFALLTTNLIEKTVQKAFTTSIGLFIGINLLTGVSGAANIDNAGHIGGLIGGLVFGYAFVPVLRNRESKQSNFTAIVLLSLASIATAVWAYKNTSNDLLVYEQKMESFQKLENEALSLYTLPDSTPNSVIVSRIDNQGVPNWNQCLKLLDEMDQLDIPMNVKQRNWKIRDYCKLRIESYRLLRLRYENNTTAYDSQLKSCDLKLEGILRELGAKI